MHVSTNLYILFHWFVCITSNAVSTFDVKDSMSFFSPLHGEISFRASPKLTNSPAIICGSLESAIWVTGWVCVMDMVH